jgi:hypothetical protein
MFNPLDTSSVLAELNRLQRNVRTITHRSRCGSNIAARREEPQRYRNACAPTGWRSQKGLRQRVHASDDEESKLGLPHMGVAPPSPGVTRVRALYQRPFEPASPEVVSPAGPVPCEVKTRFVTQTRLQRVGLGRVWSPQVDERGLHLGALHR